MRGISGTPYSTGAIFLDVGAHSMPDARGRKSDTSEAVESPAQKSDGDASRSVLVGADHQRSRAPAHPIRLMPRRRSVDDARLLPLTFGDSRIVPFGCPPPRFPGTRCRVGRVADHVRQRIESCSMIVLSISVFSPWSELIFFCVWSPVRGSARHAVNTTHRCARIDITESAARASSAQQFEPPHQFWSWRASNCPSAV